jgi:hypothetical protein
LISEGGLAGGACRTGCGAWNVCLAGAGVVVLVLFRSVKTVVGAGGSGVGQQGRGCAKRALNESDSFILERRLNVGGLDTRKPSGQPARVVN